ncbi:hypothetical protein ENSA5_08450 [Enhygromyxa salina]|uniref:Uncharacterized protein n=1 Tax=Enhygromyxa salina TaxID=215803 RepID=A0A2S9YH46_9BACT|nr:hypothetical protein [Enhygromyxa salina]PRQ04336.1 hypothetical protein ENSA5_08450 [Enhygromyxa salina]
MNITIKNTHNLPRRLALLGLFAALAVPAVSTAAPLTSDQPTPIAAGDDDDDPPCETAVIALEIDVTTGDVYIVDPTGGLTLTDNSLNIYFGTLSQVLIDIEYTSGNWEIDVTPDDETTETYQTRGGTLRYYITDDYDEYVLSSTELTGAASTMMNMTPFIPDIILQPDKDCPPST